MRSLMIFTTLALIVSCKAQQASAPAVSNSPVSIIAIGWKLTKMSDHNLSAVSAPITLTLDETKKGISGHGGCNRYFGGYQSTGETISFTGLGSTKMFCQDTQVLEDAFFKALSTVQSYKIEGSKLYLLAEGKVVLEFSQ